MARKKAATADSDGIVEEAPVEEYAPRSFRLRSDLEVDGEPVNRYSTGSFVFEPGTSVEAPTAEVAVKFAADPKLEEVA